MCAYLSNSYLVCIEMQHENFVLIYTEKYRPIEGQTGHGWYVTKWLASRTAVRQSKASTVFPPGTISLIPGEDLYILSMEDHLAEELQTEKEYCTVCNMLD